MCDVMAHRGPDDTGFYRDQALSVGMRRLSIIDLAGGQQPLYNEDGSVVVVFNGEIYNYIELREQLEARGHRFRTKSDGEVIAHLYEDRDVDALCNLNGMFGLCLWDRARQRGVLARDPLGIKPLYYWSDGQRCLFASELKALLPHLPNVAVDWEAIDAYLQHMFVPAPRSPISGVRKLPPGCFLEFSTAGVGKPRPFWDVRQLPDEVLAAPKTREHFLHLVDDAVRLQLRSDVPVGIFLSGGIDSSLVTAFSSRRLGPDVSCFTVDYEGNPVDEVRPARIVTRAFRCDHHVVLVTTADAVRLIPKLVWHMDEPHADSALVGTYKVAEAAATRVKVILNGTGGDELFGGYSWYVGNSSRTRLLHRVPARLRSAAVAMLGARQYGRLLAVHRDRETTFVWNHFLFKPQEVRGFGTAGPDVASGWSLRSLVETAPGDRVNRMLYADLRSYLPDDLLLLLDKMTMAVSIEGRVPILDHRLVEWAFTIPGAKKLPGVELKPLLKQWLSGIVPDEVLRRPKWGFGAPVGRWMADGLFGHTLRILDGRPRSRSHLFWGLRGRPLREHLEGLSPHKVFALLVLEVWLRLFVDGVQPNVSLSDLS